jgi:hypothetical protein
MTYLQVAFETLNCYFHSDPAICSVEQFAVVYRYYCKSSLLAVKPHINIFSLAHYKNKMIAETDLQH